MIVEYYSSNPDTVGTQSVSWLEGRGVHISTTTQTKSLLLCLLYCH